MTDGENMENNVYTPLYSWNKYIHQDYSGKYSQKAE